jgi:hypothetical protein
MELRDADGDVVLRLGRGLEHRRRAEIHAAGGTAGRMRFVARAGHPVARPMGAKKVLGSGGQCKRIAPYVGLFPSGATDTASPVSVSSGNPNFAAL